MSLTDMYPAKNNSPVTTLTAGINSADTSMTVEDASVLPAAPNIAVIGTTDSAEIVKYTAINSNTLTIVRGQNGTVPGVWAEGTTVARNFTALDHESFRTNILDLDNRKTDSGHTHDDRYYTETEMNTTLALKAPLASPTFTGTPTAPTPSADDDSTQIATTEYVVSHDDFIVSGSASAGSAVTFTDSRINSEHWEVDWIIFGTSSRVTTHVNWTTNITNHTVTLNATFTGATTVKINMHYVQ